MVDLTTFSDNSNDERFEKTMQSSQIAGVKNLYLSNKGIPKYPRYGEVANSSDYISDSNNVGAVLQYTYGGASPAVSFIGTWDSNSSHVLTYHELGVEDWV